jgi:hypothetical protein
MEGRPLMAKISFWQSAALAALVASGALASAPAQAQDRGGWRDRQQSTDDGSRQDRGERGDYQRGEGRSQQRAQQAPQQQQQQAPQQQQQPQVGWGSQRARGGDQRVRQEYQQQRVQQQQQQRAWRGQQQGEQQRAWRGQQRGEGGVNWSSRYQDRDGRGGNDYRREDYQRGVRQGYGDQDRNRGWQGGGRNYGGNNYRNGYRGDQRGWNNNWRQDRRYDWSSYRNSNRDLYRLGRYYAPYRNYSYRRLGSGSFLEPLFFGSSYWIADPWQYRLPEADGPYRWVRYYDDVLLVDVYSGEVVDVIYDFFY